MAWVCEGLLQLCKPAGGQRSISEGSGHQVGAADDGRLHLLEVQLDLLLQRPAAHCGEQARQKTPTPAQRFDGVLRWLPLQKATEDETHLVAHQGPGVAMVRSHQVQGRFPAEPGLRLQGVDDPENLHILVAEHLTTLAGLRVHDALGPGHRHQRRRSAGALLQLRWLHTAQGLVAGHDQELRHQLGIVEQLVRGRPLPPRRPP